MAKDPTQKAKLTLKVLDLTFTQDVTNDRAISAPPPRVFSSKAKACRLVPDKPVSLKANISRWVVKAARPVIE